MDAGHKIWDKNLGIPRDSTDFIEDPRCKEGWVFDLKLELCRSLHSLQPISDADMGPPVIAPIVPIVRNESVLDRHARKLAGLPVPNEEPASVTEPGADSQGSRPKPKVSLDAEQARGLDPTRQAASDLARRIRDFLNR